MKKTILLLAAVIGCVLNLAWCALPTPVSQGVVVVVDGRGTCFRLFRGVGSTTWIEPSEGGFSRQVCGTDADCTVGSCRGEVCRPDTRYQSVRRACTIAEGWRSRPGGQWSAARAEWASTSPPDAVRLRTWADGVTSRYEVLADGRVSMISATFAPALANPPLGPFLGLFVLAPWLFVMRAILRMRARTSPRT